jgi:hypothetical protein
VKASPTATNAQSSPVTIAHVVSERLLMDAGV